MMLRPAQNLAEALVAIMAMMMGVMKRMLERGWIDRNNEGF
jgi:hypothetical protein